MHLDTATGQWGQTCRHTQTNTDRQTDTGRWTQTDRHRQTYIDRQKRQAYRQTWKDAHRQTRTNRHKQSKMEKKKTFKNGPKRSKIVKNGSNPPIHNVKVTALLLRESLKKGCFYPHFDKFYFRTKVYLYFITTGANMLHVCHYSGILHMNLFLVCPWPYIKQANI